MNELPKCPNCGQTVTYVRSKVENPMIPFTGTDIPKAVYKEEFGCKDCGIGLTCTTEIYLDIPGQEKRELFAKHLETFIEQWDEVCEIKEYLEK